MGVLRSQCPIVFVLLLAAATQAQEVVFHRVVSRVGDQSRQQMNCDLDLEMSIQQGGNLIQSQQQQLQRLQHRTLTILESNANGPVRASIQYDKSSIALVSADLSHDSAQPVSGKTYLIARKGDKLIVTNPDGSTPPAEEKTIVVESMSSFGLPNPLSKFFDGRRVQVGQELKLPNELASDLLGFASTSGNVSEFSMKLTGVKPGRTPLAMFEIKLVAKDPNESRVSMTLTGKLVMEVESCRARTVQMTGPVAVSEVHGPPQGQYEVHSKGEIRVAVKADYRKGRR